MISKAIITAIGIEYKSRRRPPIIPGETLVSVSGKVFDEAELLSGVEAVLDGW